MVVTRAREQASGLAEALEELGACVIQFPTIAIRALDDYAAVDEAIRVLAEYDWIVFTSANGVRCFWERLEAAGLDSRALGKTLAAAMGPGTAEALRARGVRSDLVPAEHVAEGLAQALLARGAAGARVLIPRALQAREILPEELRRAGCRVDVTPVYRTAVCGEGLEAFLDRLEAGGIHCVTFASSSTVDNFFALVPPDALRDRLDRVRFACIGPVTAATLERYGFKTSIQPVEYAIPALVRALAEDLGRGEDA